ncbi:MAG: hypothetical protein ACYCYI_07375 [Saccharofermentanales bacterium]
MGVKRGFEIRIRNVSSIWGFLTVVLAGAVMIMVILLSTISLRYQHEVQFNRSVRQNLDRCLQRLEAAGSTQHAGAQDKEFQEFFSSFLTEMLSVEQFDRLARSFWDYELVVNGRIERIGNIKIEGFKGNAVITLCETEREGVLPPDLHVLGSVSKGDATDTFESHLSFASPVPFKKRMSVAAGMDSGTGCNFRKTTATYTFEPITADQAIEIIPSPILEGYRVRNDG